MATTTAPHIASPPRGGLAEGGRPRIEIVPRRGLPVVAVVVGGLIAAIATNSHWALDFYHVAGGGLWTGVDLFVGLILGPIIGHALDPRADGALGAIHAEDGAADADARDDDARLRLPARAPIGYACARLTVPRLARRLVTSSSA